MARIIDRNQCNITGQRIKEARMKAGLSQKKLSERLETEAVYVCRGSVSRIESGERTVTDIEIDAISKVGGFRLIIYSIGELHSKEYTYPIKPCIKATVFSFCRWSKRRNKASAANSSLGNVSALTGMRILLIPRI